jgi:hypothetical protein
MRIDAMLAKDAKPSNLMSREVIPMQLPLFAQTHWSERSVCR